MIPQVAAGPRPHDQRARGLFNMVVLLFFVSGALGLVYEVLWLRKLLLIFGNTVQATSTVLAVFFGGLALGSWWGGWLSDRKPEQGLQWYAWCELAIGAYALLTPWLFRAIEHVYIPMYRASGLLPAVFLGASFMCTTAILLLPTICLGATFPLLSRFMTRETFGRSATVALLYAVNTLGAVAGVLGVYYIALQRLGWLASVQCAGLLNLLIGITARMLSRHVQLADGVALPESALSPALSLPMTQPVSAHRGLMVAFGLSGFAALSYEVAWTRALSLVVGSSMYAFCLMLTTFLGGMALGSLLARRWMRRHRPSLAQLFVLEVGLSTCGLLSVLQFRWLPEWLVILMPKLGFSFHAISSVQILLSVSIMAIPTICFGMLFPLFLELMTANRQAWGRSLGAAYAINTVGSILGSLLSGFWLIPHLGLAWTIVIAALANLAAAIVLYIHASPLPMPVRLGIGTATLALDVSIAAMLIVPSWSPAVMSAGVYLNAHEYGKTSVAKRQEQYELLFYRESLNSTVSVHRSKQNPDETFLKIGGKTDASTGLDMGTQILSAQIPLLLHPQAKDVFVLGWGSGVTAGSAGTHPVTRIDVAEMDPAVIEAARYFAQANHHAAHDPRVHVYVADGRNFLLATPQRYDVIMSEPSNPWMAGVANLFTKEFYDQAKARLRPDGLMCQWFHVYRMFPSDVKLILHTFQETFPYVSVWSSVPGDLLLVGSQQPHQISYDALAQRMAQPIIREELARIGLTHPRVFLDLYWFGSEQIQRLCADTPDLHRDDMPWLEFHAPRALYLGSTFHVNYVGLQRFKTGPTAVVPDAPPAPETAAYYAALGEAYRFRREYEEAARALEQAVALEPANTQIQATLTHTYAQLHVDEKMRQGLEEAAALNPHDVDQQRLLARVLWREDKLEEAWRVYARVASIEPPNRELAEEMGALLRKMERLAEAAECFRSARSQDAEDRPKLLTALAQTLQDAEQVDEAARVLELALAQHPMEASLILQLAQVRMAQGHQEEARALFERAIALGPLSDAYFGLGALAREAGEVKRALHWMMTGLRLDPYNLKALETLHELQEQQHG